MSYPAKSRRPTHTALRLLLAYLVLTSTLPVSVASAQSKAKATPPARKSEQQTSRPAARATKEPVTPSALQANGKLAFASNRSGAQFDIFVMNSDGSGVVNLTNNPASDSAPTYSPDGARIAFKTNRDGNDEIYSMNADGTSQTNLTNHAGNDGEAAFSPDGSKIAFTSTRDGNEEIYLMNADGTGQVRLTNHADGDFGAAFSPDGSKIAFASTRDGGDGEIYVMNADGTGQTRLTTTGGVSPSYSPDGTKITYTSGSSGIGNAVVVMNANGTNQTAVTANPASDEDSSFSPDGTKIVFRSDRDGNVEIYVMNADGTGQTRLTNDAASDFEPAWQTLLSCAPPPANAVVWYRAEENADDSIGTNHGTLQNGTAIVQGFVGAAFEFDGVDDVVDIGQLTGLQNAQQLTVMAWVKKRDTSNTIAGIIGKWDGCSGCVDDTFLLYNGEAASTHKGGFVVRFTDDTAAAVAGTTDIPVGQWVHITATWRSSDGEIRIYKNGRLDGSGTGGAGKTLKYQTNYTAKIGEWGEGHGGNPVYRFGGAIDEATIFNRALSQAEIQNVYDAKNEGKCLASAAQTITTSNTNDSGPGSLRQAILDANASPGTQTIDFNIPGAGVRTISPTSPLPAITDPIVIDGYTQPGASANTLDVGNNAVLLIELNGTGAGAGTNGLNITAGDSTVRGLVINRFTAAGVRLATGNTNFVEGCFIGTNAAGTTDLGNTTDGVIIVSSSSNSIGGTTAAARNVISGNNSGGVEINGGNLSNNLIRGNYIGTNAAGQVSVPNGTGINVAGTPNVTNNTIGGLTTAPGTGSGNVISGNINNGILISGSAVSGTLVQGNIIGLSADGASDLGNAADGINVATSANNTIGGADPQSRNVISGNNSEGIQLTSAVTNKIQNNYIGTDSTGALDRGNTAIGISANNCANLTVGGANAGNVISGNNSDGITLAGASSGTSITGNFIGTSANGTADLGNGGDGLQSGSAVVNIGGTTAAERNVISGNSGHGINLLASNNNIRGNFIGVASDGTTGLNNNDGINIGGTNSSNIIGGTGAGEGNTIAFNNGDGVNISGTGTGNLISANSIYSNGLAVNNLGIDLSTNGVGINDAGDADTGANNLQNYPVLSGVTSGGGTTTITGTLNSSANTTYSVEFFASQIADPSGNGEGQTFLGAASVTTDGSGNATINQMLPVALTPVSYVTATATDPANNTSEFSNFVALDATTLTVTNTNASGAGSLAQAITDSNLISGTQTITFNIPGGGVKTISLAANQGLTASDTVIIDGYTQPGASANTLATGNDAVLLIEIVGTVPTVLTLQGGGSTVRGLVLRSSGNDGIAINGGGNVVEGCFLGTDPTGTLDRGNVGGIRILTANNRIGGTLPAQRNLISGNTSGVVISGAGASGNIIQGNYIGTNKAGTAALANSSGVFFGVNAPNNTLGGTAAGAGNLISGNLTGITFQTAGNGNVIQGNLIGTDAAGTSAVGNSQGMSLALTANTTIGGTAAGAANTIAFNNSQGILLQSNAGLGNAILGNSIHTNTTLGIDLNNDNIVTPNDAGDADTGPNNLQNFPVLTSATSGGGNTVIQGTLNSAANTQFRVEFFSNPICDGSGNGEGRTFIGATDVTTDAGGNATINATLAGAATVGHAVTATATDPANNTSEFSACQTVAGGASTSVSWINPAGGAWNVAANWLDTNGVNRVPTAGDDAVIDLAGTYTVTLASPVSVNTLTLGATLGAQTLDTGNFALTLANDSNVGQRGILVVNGTLNGAGNLAVGGTLEHRGTLSGAGAVNIAAGATLNIGGSQPVLSRTINNSGTTIYNVANSLVFSDGAFNNLAGGSFDARADKLIFTSGGANFITNAGTLQKTQGTGTTDFNLNVSNNGTVDIQSGTLAFNASYSQSAGTTRLNGGNLSSTSLINILGGTLSGTGTITGNVQNAGTVSPGLSPGVFNIAGNYTQLASGILAIEIGGTTVGSQHDQLAVTGTATLAGALNTTLTGGYNPGFNDQIVVLTYGARSGTFTTINAAAFTPAYNANNLTLTSNAPPPSILSVTNTNDAGAGSLRQAIIDANATAGVQTINFQIAGAGVQTITPDSPLPQVNDAVIIDGYTQPGASANTLSNGDNAVLLVELNGTNAGAGADGLHLNTNGSTIKGLVINRFTGAGVNISGGSNNRIEGNFIGTNAAGASALANNRGVNVSNSLNNTIGGTTPAARNLLSGNNLGVHLFAGATGTFVQGNFVGTTASGNAPLANTFAGLHLNATSGNTVGGTAAGTANVISGNATGIFITQGSTSNTVQGNRIGTGSDSTVAVANTLPGVFITQSSNGNTIGGASAGAGNTIAFNGGGGVIVDASLNNPVNGNSIHSNAALGLDLLPAGVTANDAGDADAGANNLQNFPLLSSVTVANGNTTFNGTLASAANTAYSLHFYSNAACDPSGNGEGETYLGTTILTTNASGDAAFNFTINGLAVPANRFVTATATDPAGNTSEFSACLQPSAPPGTFTISGQILEGASGLSGVTVTLSGTQAATTTTNATGNYSFANVAAGGNYVVTPSLANYTFAPPSQSFNNLSADQTANFAATLNTVTISGQVTENGVALPGVTVTLSGTQSGTATTDASGNYSFVVPFGGDYVIIPSLTHYTFNPSARAVNSLTNNLTANFAATRNTHSIGGQIRDNQNAPLAAVTVTLSGGQSATTATDANGNYSFANLPAGANYIVTPTLANYAFAPPSVSFNNLSANGTANFTGTPGAHTISGRVADASNNSLANVTITLSGAQSGTALTDAGGNYAFNVASGGSYTVTPTLANYTFAPPSATFNNIAANQTANFTGTLQTFSIGGRIADTNNNGIAGASVVLSGGQAATTTTDASGNYSFANLPAGANYTVTPSLAGYTFVPSNATFNNLSANATANFLGSAQAPQPVSGRVLDKSDGSGIANVTLYVTDATTGAPLATTTTDANGNYTFMLPPGGDYTVTTAKAGLTFQPAARTFGNLSDGQTSDFTATEGLDISGRVAGPNGNGIGNVIVTLSGSVSRTVLTLPNGSFLFTNLPVNGNYTVQADSGLLIFNPLQVTRPDLASDVTLNLVAAPRPAPVPTPPIEEDFSGTTRDPLKFSEGTLTQPAGSKDPLVTVVQEGGVLKITPRAGIAEASFNGYVTSRAIDFTDATASVEVNQTADNGAQTIFGVGRDERNYFRFIAQDVDDPLIPVAKAGAVTKRSTGLRRLIFQARSAGVLNGLPPSILFHPDEHKFWRFRHSSAESAMFFETSPDRVNWTEQRRIALAGPIGLLSCELSGGTSGLVTNPGQAIFDNLSVQPNAFVNRANNVRLTQSSLRVNENAGFLTLKAVRAGDTSRETRLDYATEPHDGKPCNTQDGKARARCDFGTTAGTIRFAPGETEKTFTVFITDDNYAEGDETIRVALGFPSAGVVEEPVSALVTIVDNDAGATPHPINTAPFLVRQQYLDFLNREPEENGFNAWVGVLRGCAFEGHFGPGKSGSDPACDRITVSSSFFRSSEFQFKGFFVYRFYKATLGRAPSYEEFLRDMTSVTGQTEAEVVARREAFANAWVERGDFVALNEGITNAEFIEQLETTAGVALAGRAQLILDLNNGSKTRAQVLRVMIDSPELFNREYNAAFVLMQYFGYLQRDPDEAGYNGWLNLLDRTGDYRTMIFGFLYSQEYLLRFGQP